MQNPVERPPPDPHGLCDIEIEPDTLGEGVPEDVKSHLCGTGSLYDGFVPKKTRKRHKRRLVLAKGKRIAKSDPAPGGDSCSARVKSKGEMRGCKLKRAPGSEMCKRHLALQTQGTKE